MTRKDYRRAAILVKENYPDETDPERWVIINFLIKFFLSDNPSFDQERFILACGE